MKIFRKLAVVAVAALAAAAFAACGDDNSTVEPQPLPPVEPVIGQYTFDGKVYDIRHATVFFDGTSYAFVFSGQERATASFGCCFPPPCP